MGTGLKCGQERQRNRMDERTEQIVGTGFERWIGKTGERGREKKTVGQTDRTARDTGLISIFVALD